ncbi:MlaD family protein [Tsukamurella sp. 1534]|uniref:MlaD family protein n=1 Tax=Tsukamurella sp. 1534 TaxID=1151061 RepID=UPI000313A637|nr:MlaD family protein [Tsukamurella sp. 1534]
MKRELIANVITFVVVLTLGVSALVFGYMGVRPGTKYTTVTMQLPQSAQLVTGSSVLMRGVRIGEVERVDAETRGVAVRIKYPDTNKVPVTSAVTIEQLTALGEPYVEFAPDGTDGPFLADGAVLDAKRVSVPTSIPDIFRSLSAMSRIAEAGPLADLVKTMWQATTGTDAAMPRLTEAGNLLTTTLVSRMPQIRTMFTQTQVYSADMGWMGSAIGDFGPAFRGTIDAIRPAVDKVQDVVGELDLPRPFTENLHPFAQRLDPYLRELMPKIAEIMGPSLAILKAVDNTLPIIDLSAFLSSALAMVGPDGTPRLAVTIPVPGTVGAPKPAAPSAAPSSSTAPSRASSSTVPTPRSSATSTPNQTPIPR